MQQTARLGFVAALALTTVGCAALGKLCTSMQKTGEVASLSGRVEARGLAMHIVPYDQRGTQNDSSIAWTGQEEASGPRLRLYAVGMGCTAEMFAAGVAANGTWRSPPHGDPCARLGATTGTRSDTGLVQRKLHVPGGPQQNRPDLHEYRLFILGDPQQDADYTIRITRFAGPDC